MTTPDDPTGEPIVIDLWPPSALVPDETVQLPPEADATTPTHRLIGGKRVVRITNVSRPTLTLHRAPPSIDTGTTVVICPGGGYGFLAIEHEGTDVARWLNALGVNAAILKYRVPIGEAVGRTRLQPQQDAQRAMRLLRHRAGAWGLNPGRIGILGFSAGAHLAWMTCQNADEPRYGSLDDADQQPSRLDFAALIYIAWITDDHGCINADIRVPGGAPPLFILHAMDDNVAGPVNSLQLAILARAAGVAVEAHLFPTGGHGFGIRRTDHRITAWPDLCRDWMASLGWMRRP